MSEFAPLIERLKSGDVLHREAAAALVVLEARIEQGSGFLTGVCNSGRLNFAHVKIAIRILEGER